MKQNEPTLFSCTWNHPIWRGSMTRNKHCSDGSACSCVLLQRSRSCGDHNGSQCVPCVHVHPVSVQNEMILHGDRWLSMVVCFKLGLFVCRWSRPILHGSMTRNRSHSSAPCHFCVICPMYHLCGDNNRTQCVPYVHASQVSVLTSVDTKSHKWKWFDEGKQTVPGFLQSKSSHFAWQHDQKQALFLWMIPLLRASSGVSHLWWPHLQSMYLPCSCAEGFGFCLVFKRDGNKAHKKGGAVHKQRLVSCNQSRPTLRDSMTRNKHCSGEFCHHWVLLQLFRRCGDSNGNQCVPCACVSCLPAFTRDEKVKTQKENVVMKQNEPTLFSCNQNRPIWRDSMTRNKHC